MQLVRQLGMQGNVTALAWHPRLNQIFAGTGRVTVNCSSCVASST